jgi:predicted dehydrogenase
MRFGLLGTGRWAADTHAVALADAPQAELVAVWGRDPAKAADLAQRHGARAYEDVDALLDAVDAVAVALPPDVQAPLAARAARAGKHLLLDKPLALDVASADEVVAAAEATGVASVIFFTRRFQPEPAAWLADAVAAGGWGAGRATLLAALGPDQLAASPWRDEHGGLWDLGPHALSLLLPALGPVTDVLAADGPYRTSHLLLTHESGAVSSLALSLHVPRPAASWDIELYGTAGRRPAPDGGDVVGALRTAVAELTATAAAGRADHPCGVQFGREVVSVLARAERR